MPYCPNCGEEIPEGKKFCYYCGHPLPILDRESSSTGTKSPVIPEPVTSPEPPQSIPEVRPVVQEDEEPPQFQNAGSTEGLTGSYPAWVENAIIGTVRNLEQRYSGSGKIYSFRLELTDTVGNITEMIPVEFDSGGVKGLILKEGDLIAMTGGRDNRGLFQPKKIYDAATGAERPLPRGYFIKKMFFNILIFIGVISLVIGLLIFTATPLLFFLGIALIAIGIFLKRKLNKNEERYFR